MHLRSLSGVNRLALGHRRIPGSERIRILKAQEFQPISLFALLCSSIVAFNQAAMALPLAQCVRELVSAGVSPNVAADKCVMGRGTDPDSVDSRIEKYEKCVERIQYSVLKGSPHTRGDGKTEYEYSSLDARDMDWVRITGASCWVHGVFNAKLLCWDSEIKREIRSPQAAAIACRALIPNNSIPEKGTIIINQSGN